jgi:hypothetical protein
MMRLSRLALCLLLLSLSASAAEKPRVFITDSDSWQIAGGFGAGANSAGGVIKGGARPQTVEIMKTFAKRCPQVTVTAKQERADYVVLLDHEGGKGAVRKDNKVAVFDKEGDLIYSGSTRMLGNAVKDACNAIKKGLPTT